MALFVWRGDRVLKNYGTGLVVISSTTAETAWLALRFAAPAAWLALNKGIRIWVDSEAEIVSILADSSFEPEAGEFPIEPEVFEPTCRCW